MPNTKSNYVILETYIDKKPIKEIDKMKEKFGAFSIAGALKYPERNFDTPYYTGVT
jgi:hypothetical protein